MELPKEIQNLINDFTGFKNCPECFKKHSGFFRLCHSCVFVKIEHLGVDTEEQKCFSFHSKSGLPDCECCKNYSIALLENGEKCSLCKNITMDYHIINEYPVCLECYDETMICECCYY
tara:strand:+ start:2127 stop:2480 length:354 start_codon:yes stop_codon:yes gene_type:complete